MTTGRPPSHFQSRLNHDASPISVDALLQQSDYDFVTYLDQRDTDGNPYLYRAYHTQPKSFHHILERISKIKSNSDKKTINKAAIVFDSQSGHTLFHEIVEHKS